MTEREISEWMHSNNKERLARLQKGDEKFIARCHLHNELYNALGKLCSALKATQDNTVVIKNPHYDQDKRLGRYAVPPEREMLLFDYISDEAMFELPTDALESWKGSSLALTGYINKVLENISKLDPKEIMLVPNNGKAPKAPLRIASVMVPVFCENRTESIAENTRTLEITKAVIDPETDLIVGYISNSLGDFSEENSNGKA